MTRRTYLWISILVLLFGTIGWEHAAREVYTPWKPSVGIHRLGTGLRHISSQLGEWVAIVSSYLYNLKDWIEALGRFMRRCWNTMWEFLKKHLGPLMHTLEKLCRVAWRLVFAWTSFFKGFELATLQYYTDKPYLILFGSIGLVALLVVLVKHHMIRACVQNALQEWNQNADKRFINDLTNVLGLSKTEEDVTTEIQTETDSSHVEGHAIDVVNSSRLLPLPKKYPITKTFDVIVVIFFCLKDI